MDKMLKGSSSKFVVNLFKSLGIVFTLGTTSSCSDNVVNKIDRGNEKMLPSEPKIEKSDEKETSSFDDDLSLSSPTESEDLDLKDTDIESYKSPFDDLLLYVKGVVYEKSYTNLSSCITLFSLSLNRFKKNFNVICELYCKGYSYYRSIGYGILRDLETLFKDIQNTLDCAIEKTASQYKGEMKNLDFLLCKIKREIILDLEKQCDELYNELTNSKLKTSCHLYTKNKESISKYQEKINLLSELSSKYHCYCKKNIKTAERKSFKNINLQLTKKYEEVKCELQNKYEEFLANMTENKENTEKFAKILSNLEKDFISKKNEFKNLYAFVLTGEKSWKDINDLKKGGLLDAIDAQHRTFLEQISTKCE